MRQHEGDEPDVDRYVLLVCVPLGGDLHIHDNDAVTFAHI